MYLRRNSKTKMEVSIDEPLNVDWDGNELLLSDILGTDEDVISRRLEDEVEISLLSKKGECCRENTERGCRPSGNFSIIYFQVGKKDHEEIEKGNCEI